MKKIFVIALASLSLGSCKKTLEKINTNPNASENASPGLLFTTAAVSAGALRSSGDFYIPFGLAAQTIASGGDAGWGKTNVYDIDIYPLGNSWKSFYSTAGLNLKEAIRIAESNVPAEDGAAAQCKVLLAQSMYDATMIWGDIPYSEAWQASTIPYPKFDRQEDLLNSLLALLDEAIAQMDSENAASTAITGQDFFYNGDLSKWKALAHSMKFRILMVMVDRDPSKATAIQELISGGNMISDAGANFMLPFGTTASNWNPKYSILYQYAGGTNLFFFANTTVLNPMKAQNDPRIPVYFDKPADAEDYEGVLTELTADPDVTATISMYLYRQDAPELMFSYQEQLFLEAEAYARGFASGGLAVAEEKYKAALAAACSYYGVDAASTGTFVDSKSIASMSTAAAIDEIHLQQWIDLMDRPLDAFTNWRRSGPAGDEVPRLTLPLGAPAGGLMRRWLYPLAEEVSPNVNAPKEAALMTDKLWFDL